MLATSMIRAKLAGRCHDPVANQSIQTFFILVEFGYLDYAVVETMRVRQRRSL